MRLRSLLALALLAASLCLERLSYYAMRSTLVMEMRDQGVPIGDIGSMYAAMIWISLLATVVAGGLAFAIGPRVVAAIGALVAALGHFAIAAGGPSLGTVALVALGSGLLRPCPMAAAAEALSREEGDRPNAPPSPRRFAAVVAFSVISYGAINFGSMLAPVLGTTVHQKFGAAAAHLLSGGIATAGALLAGGAALLGALSSWSAAITAAPGGPYRSAERREPAFSTSPGDALAGLAILFASGLIYAIGMTLSDAPPRLSTSPWVFSVNPVAVCLGSVGLFGVALAATIGRWTTPPLHAYGAGLALFGLGLVPIALSVQSGDEVIYVLGAAITGFSEVAVGAIGVAYAALAVPPRAAALTVAGWFGISNIVFAASGLILGTLDAARTALLVLVALLCIGLGGALFAAARRIHVAFFDPPPSPERAGV